VLEENEELHGKIVAMLNC